MTRLSDITVRKILQEFLVTEALHFIVIPAGRACNKKSKGTGKQQRSSGRTGKKGEGERERERGERRERGRERDDHVSIP